jgi:hypothetical protein
MPLARDDEHHAVFGQNGSGKTVFGLYMLSKRSYDRMPWYLIDFKRDEIIRDIPRLEETDIHGTPTKHKGLYVVRPMPTDVDDGTLTKWLYRLWENGKTGLFIDEGYGFRTQWNPALRAVLTQGRSKKIPVIALSQRPSWVSPFILSESTHMSVFYLQMPQDVARVREFLPDARPKSLPPHEQYYAYLKGREFHHVAACPDENEVLDMFDRRTVRKGWF